MDIEKLSCVLDALKSLFIPNRCQLAWDSKWKKKSYLNHYTKRLEIIHSWHFFMDRYVSSYGQKSMTYKLQISYNPPVLCFSHEYSDVISTCYHLDPHKMVHEILNCLCYA